MNSCDAGCVESVKVLLERGASVNDKSNEGYTALHLIAQYKDETSADIANLLIKSGAVIDESAQSGWTPLMNAQASGNVQLQALLVENGADPKAMELHMAARGLGPF